MLRAAIVGVGWWAGTLTDAVADSDLLRFTTAVSRSGSPKDLRFAEARGLEHSSDFSAVLGRDDIDAMVLATPPAGHLDQLVAAVRAGKHVFCEKPFVMTRSEAERAVAAASDAKVTLAVGYNRRFHPAWRDLKSRIANGSLGTILHIECTMSGPNGLSLDADAWRARPEDAPCGGLFPMGVHAVDGLVDLFGEIESVFCTSVHRAVPSDNDDTTSVLFRLKAGMTAYLGTMTATAASFRFQVYGSAGTALLTGATHVIGQTSHQRRAGLFGSYVIQPIKGDPLVLPVGEYDVNRAELEAFARAVAGGEPYPIPTAEMVHVVAATEAIIASARSGEVNRIA